MRHVGSLLAVLAITFSGCGGVTDEDRVADRPQAGRDNGLRSGSAETIEENAAVYAAVVRQLVTKDHTFGGAPSPFKRVYVVDGVVADASDPRMPAYLNLARPFAAELKKTILRMLADLPRVEFLSDPEAVIVDEKTCPRVKGDGVLISLGSISEGDRPVTVATGLFFACEGGQWLTYVLERSEAGWQVVGTRGPVAIS
jgi:hypothetical protein